MIMSPINVQYGFSSIIDSGLFDLPIIEVVAGSDKPVTEQVYTDVAEGKLVNSGFLDGLSVAEAKKKITEFLEEKGIGRPSTYAPIISTLDKGTVEYGLPNGEKVQLDRVFLDGSRIFYGHSVFILMVHFPFSAYQPLQIELGVVEDKALQKVVSGLVSPGQNVGHAASGDRQSVCQLGLCNVLCLQEL